MDGLIRGFILTAISGFALMQATAASSAPPALHVIDGTDFPEHAIALFYDDGPDKHSLELAEFLHAQGISATFNLVGALKPLDRTAAAPSPSSDGTGYLADYPNYLASLAALHQRISNHTLNHVPLDGASNTGICSYDPQKHQSMRDCIRYQVNAAENYLSPYISNGLFTLTPPGGRWSTGLSDSAVGSSAESLLHVDPGPSYPIGFSSFTVQTPDPRCGLRWEHPGRERLYVNAYDWCYAELGYPPEVYVRDLENAIEAFTASSHRGMYIFNHDRNEGAPGTTYALDTTEYLVSYLQRRGYVFVGPVMWFSHPYSQESYTNPVWATQPSYYETFRTADVTGDGHPSVCARGPEGVYCAHSQLIPSAGLGSSPKITFGQETLWSTAEFSDAVLGKDISYSATMMLADVDRDGKADLIIRTPKGLAVAQSDGTDFGTSQIRSSGADFSDNDTDPLNGDPSGWQTEPSRYETFRIADVNGDGYPDICARTAGGVVCALNDKKGGFLKYTLWEREDFSDAAGGSDFRYASTMMLADMNGDGMADLVMRTPRGIMVALSNGKGFGRPQLWSSGNDFSNSDVDTVTKSPMNWLQNGRYQTFRAVDINGDGKADICAMGPSGMVCALSNGTKLLKSTNWDNRYAPQFTAKKGWVRPEFMSTLMFADLNGDDRADIIVRNMAGLLMGYAP